MDLESFQARHAAVIYNPVARGLSRHLPLLQRTTGILAQQGIEAKLVATTAPGSAGAQARQQIEAGCDLIVAAGGDGTINEVVEGMLHTEVPLAILPGGTANVLAREMRLPIHMGKAASRIPELVRTRIAVGRLRVEDQAQRAFVCMAGAGLDAEIIYRLNLDLKAAAGKLAYYVGGFAQVLRPLREFDVDVDGTQYRASFALISRVRNYGGDLEIARGASLLRDDFEIVLFRGTVSARYLGYLAAVAVKQVTRFKGCTVLHGRSVSCTSLNKERIYAQVDGELAGSLPVTMELVPDAITLLAPADYLTRERSLLSLSAAYA